MINFASLENLNSTSANGYDLWSRDEKMAYCESFSALISEKKASGVNKIFSSLFSLIIG